MEIIVIIKFKGKTMKFVGIIGKNISLKNINNQEINIIRLDEKNIINVKNIKFQLIIINEDLSNFNTKLEYLEKILENTEYVIINSDIYIKMKIKPFKKKVITYGLNHKATVTISSIKDGNVLIDLQREIETLNKKVIESEEKLVQTTGTVNVYEILINYIVNTIIEK